ncbi:MAG: tetratricopeptide repeat protein [Anaerolineales bacterium]
MAENTTNNSLFDEGVAAARQGDRVKARTAFTRLLRTEKENVDAWLWMSSVVDTDRERIYCLNTALKLDPDSKVALRGLALLGALPAELRPTPAYDFETDGAGSSATEPQQPQRRRRFRLRRSRRLEFALIVVLLLALGGVGFIFVGNQVAERLRIAQITPSPTSTPTATSTYTPTVTLTPTAEIRTATPIPTAAAAGPSLAEILGLDNLPTATPLPPVLDNFYPTGDTQLRAGIRAYEAGEYESATVTLADALQTNPEMVEAYYYSGLAYLELENYLQAADQFNKAIQLRADFVPAFVGRGRANFGLGFDPLQHYQDAQRIDPTWPDTYIYESIYYNLTGQPDAALEAIEAGLAQIPGHVELRWRHAAQMLIAGQAEAAFDEVEAALLIDPTAVEAYLVRGEVLNALGRYADAQADLNAYIYLRPDDPRGLRAFAAAYVGLGDPATAILHLTNALALAPDSIELLLERGNAYLAMEDFTSAEQDFLAVENATNSVAARLGLGRAKMGQGQIDAAREEFGRAVELAPGAFEPTYQWALAEFAAGQVEFSLQLLTDALRLATATTELAEARFERAREYASVGRVNEAIADLRVVLTFNLPPSHDTLRVEAGQMLSTLGGPLPGPTHTATPGG